MGLFGNLIGGSFNKASATTTQSSSNDNRQVNDASNGGTVVSGSNNTVTDGGAFGIVSRLIDGVVGVAQAQTVAARDIGTGRNSPMAGEITDAGKANAAGFLGLSEGQSYVAVGLAVALGIGLILKGA